MVASPADVTVNESLLCWRKSSFSLYSASFKGTETSPPQPIKPTGNGNVVSFGYSHTATSTQRAAFQSKPSTPAAPIRPKDNTVKLVAPVPQGDAVWEAFS